MPVTDQVNLSVGRLDDYKRNDTLVQAMSHVSHRARLVVCGSGPDRDRLERLADEAGVRDRVDFPGYVSQGDLARWRAAASVIASLSTHESFGLSLVEGALTGAPLVLSDIGPHREVAEMLGVTPQFVPVGAPASDVARSLDVALDVPRSLTPPHLASWDDRTRETIVLYERARRTERSW
jgi:glycosyltransferase involved in cell wall biosynthesis